MLEGRCAVVTGAASGIGKAIAVDAAARGMDLMLGDVDEAGLAAVAGELGGRNTRVATRRVDVRDAADVAAFSAAALAAFPSIALVMANAGLLRTGSAIRPDIADWNLTIDVNLRGIVHCVAGLLGPLIDRGQPAQFVITGSQASFVVGPDIASYCATKHALWAYADALRMELSMQPGPVGVSLLAPGRVRSAITDTSRARLLADKGEAAANAYDSGLMEAATLAHFAIDRAAERAFWIMPAADYVQPLTTRVADLLAQAEYAIG